MQFNEVPRKNFKWNWNVPNKFYKATTAKKLKRRILWPCPTPAEYLLYRPTFPAPPASGIMDRAAASSKSAAHESAAVETGHRGAPIETGTGAGLLRSPSTCPHNVVHTLPGTASFFLSRPTQQPTTRARSRPLAPHTASRLSRNRFEGGKAASQRQPAQGRTDRRNRDFMSGVLLKGGFLLLCSHESSL